MAVRALRHKVTAGLTAGLAAALVGVTLTSTADASGTTTSTASAAPADVTLVRTKHSLLGTHRWYQQTFKGLPVIGGYYAEHADSAGAVTSVDDGRDAVPAGLVTAASVDAATATRTANSAVNARAANSRAGGKHGTAVPAAGQATARLAVVGGKNARLVWTVVSRSAEGVTRSLVDAKTGQTVEVTVLSRSADGTGRVFDPNPVVTLRDESLTDLNDKNQDALWPAYKNVLLPRLDGSGTLSGQYVRIAEAKGGLATSSSNTFVYERQNNRFEQVMAYYAVDKTQDYIHQLGFTDVNNEAQDFSINTFSGDNSFYSPDTDVITMGEGGVDDAEDAEVIWHEYGHAIQDDVVPGFGETLEAGSIGEGFGDYWAVTMSVPTSRGFELPCVMDWDATSYTTDVPHCLRRTDTGKTTDDVEGEVHADGEIWSNALWDIHSALGRDRANKVILEATFFYAPDTSFADAARDTVQAARLLYGKPAANAVTKAFTDRKILQP
jgi:Zn-dependent metalloprotease